MLKLLHTALLYNAGWQDIPYLGQSKYRLPENHEVAAITLINNLEIVSG